MSTETTPHNQSAQKAQQAAQVRKIRQFAIIVLGVLIVGGGAYSVYSRRVVSEHANKAADKLRSAGFDVNFSQAEGADSPIPFLQQVGRKMRIQLHTQGKIDPDAIAVIKSIDEDMHIVFENCKEFDDGHLAQLKDKKNIRWLNVGGTKITDAGLASINELRLEQLELPWTAITDAGIAKLSPEAMAKLTDVSFANTKIGDEGMKHMAGAPNLKQLDMSGTQATAEGKTSLRSRLPGVLIIGGKTMVEGETQAGLRGLTNTKKGGGKAAKKASEETKK